MKKNVNKHKINKKVISDHNKNEERWRAPWAWNSEDDLLSPRALRIVENIQPVMKRPRLPEGPHWWEQASGGTAAAVPRPAQRAEEDTSFIPPDWSLPAFPGCSATAPHDSGGGEEGLPEVTLPSPSGGEAGLPEAALPSPGRCGGAEEQQPGVTRPTLGRRGGAARSSAGRPRSRPLLPLVAGLAYLVYLRWVDTCGDDFLDAFTEWMN